MHTRVLQFLTENVTEAERIPSIAIYIPIRIAVVIQGSPLTVTPLGTAKTITVSKPRGSEVVAVENENWDYCYSKWTG